MLSSAEDNLRCVVELCRFLESSLGPKGGDKLLVDDLGRATVTNDGATILKLLDLQHPVARVIADLSLSQDNTVGDGTTSAALFSCYLFMELYPLIHDLGLHCMDVVGCLHTITQLCLEKLQEIYPDSKSENAGDLNRHQSAKTLAFTSLQSKSVRDQADHYAALAVEAISRVSSSADGNISNIHHLLVVGGDVGNSTIIDGVVFSFYGDLKPPHETTNASCALVNIPTADSTTPSELWDCAKSLAAIGVGYLISASRLSDQTVSIFSSFGIHTLHHIGQQSLKLILQACPAKASNTWNQLLQRTKSSSTDSSFLSDCRLSVLRFGMQIFASISYSQGSVTNDCTIIHRGPSLVAAREAERAMHDAICVSRIGWKGGRICPGGGAVELTLAELLEAFSKTKVDALHFVSLAYAKALRCIFRALVRNAGLSPEILERTATELPPGERRSWYGLDLEKGSLCDMAAVGILEPLEVKLSYLSLGMETCATLLRIDQTIMGNESSAQRVRRLALLTS